MAAIVLAAGQWERFLAVIRLLTLDWRDFWSRAGLVMQTGLPGCMQNCLVT
jgi:hypothetical protein